MSSLLNCVPCVLKTCSRANVPCVLTCSRANMLCVLKCSRANVSCVLACQRVLGAYVVTCQCALRAYVLMCKRAILNNVNSYIMQICYLYLGLNRGNIGETLVSLLETFTSSSVGFRSLGGLKMFGKKSLGKCAMYIWYSSNAQTLLSCFSFAPVLNQRH